MTIDCNSLCHKCEVPIRFDNYNGCSHACAYCFVRRTTDIDQLAAKNCVAELRAFIEGKRGVATKWCDWNIPLHWGGISDPFQKLERTKRLSLECLKVFAETKYPFIVSTKGTVIADPEYLEVLRETNGVVQMSMVSKAYDSIERGAPTYAERLKVLPLIAANCKRLIVRHQPYMREVFMDVLRNLKVLKDAGVHSVIMEGLVSTKPRKGMVRAGVKRYAYDPFDLEHDFLILRDEAHRVGLGFQVGEDSCRDLGDDSCCCGVADLQGFRTNRFNALNLALGVSAEPTPAMKVKGTARCFRIRTAENEKRIKKSSFYDETLLKRDKLWADWFGKDQQKQGG